MAVGHDEPGADAADADRAIGGQAGQVVEARGHEERGSLELETDSRSRISGQGSENCRECA